MSASPETAAGTAAAAARFRWRLDLLSLPLLVLIWALAAAWVQDRLLPSPLAVAVEIADQIRDGHMIADFSKTLARVGAAFGLAMALGSLIGAALGRWRAADALFSPWLVIGLNLPALVVAIVCYIWIGLSEVGLVSAVVINKTPLVATAIREGVRGLSADHAELARVYRMGVWRRLRLVELPQLAPHALTAARAGLALIWKIVLVFEVLGSDGGVGFRIGIFFSFFDMAAILAYAVGFIAVVLAAEYGVMRPLERRVLGWRPARP